MRLRDARLCLDCDEVHDSAICPVCGSESFTYISRWVPLPETERPSRPELAEQANVYRELLSDEGPPRRGKLLKGGLLGLTALGLAGWAWRTARPPKGKTKT
jgi:RNA polymerase subunit RPABC4/transcription elongation factor Spt4